MLKRAALGLLSCLVLLGSFAVTGCSARRPGATSKAPKASAEAVSAQDPSPQLAAFDQAWQRIAETFPHVGMNGLDWNAVRDELRPKAARARSADDLRPILDDMVGRLKESHFGVISGPGPATGSASGSPSGAVSAAPSASVLGDLGLDVRPLGEEMLVTRVEAGSPAALAGVRLGWSLIEADGLNIRRELASLRRDMKDRKAADLNAWLFAMQALHGEPGSTAALTFVTGSGGRKELRIARRVAPGEPFQFGNLPLLVTRFQHETLPGNVALLRFNIFLIPVAAPFTAAMRDIVASKARGVIIDLRGNPGGIGGMVMGLSGHFIGKSGTSLGTMTTREATLNFVANPRGKSQLFDGPVAILVDGMSVSTSELFAAGLQENGRARVFGETSAGMALPSIVETLPNGDRLQFAVADLNGPSGRRIEGRGIVPDVVTIPTREQLLAGHDPALEAALAWIAEQDGTAEQDGAAAR